MFEPTTSSGAKAASSAIIARPCRLMGFQLNAGSATTTMVLYDNASGASGTELDHHILAANANSTSDWFGPNGLACSNGIYLSLSGTGAQAIVYYSPL